MTTVNRAFRTMSAYAAAAKTSRVEHDRSYSRAPATAAQRSLWLTESLSDGRNGYTVTHGYHFQGSLDGDALLTALRMLLARHGALRTRFEIRTAQLWQVVDRTPTLDVTMTDLRRSTIRRPLEAAMADRLPEPLDLTNGPLVRAEIVTIHDEEHVLLLHIHHAVNDAASMAIVEQDLCAFYEAARASSPARVAGAAQFAYYARAPGGDVAAAAAFWAEELDGFTAVPPGRAVEADGTYPAAWESLDCTEHYAAAARLGSQLGTSPFAVFMTAMQLAVAQQQGVRDVVVGTTVSVRPAGYESAVGPFVNTLPIRTRISLEWTVRGAIGAVTATLARVLEHHEVPFEDAGATFLPRSSESAPAIPVTLTSNTTIGPGLTLTGVTSRRLVLDSQYCQRDLAVYIVPLGDAIQLRACRNRSVHDAGETRALLGAMRDLVGRFADAVDEPLDRVVRGTPVAVAVPNDRDTSDAATTSALARVRKVWSEVLKVDERDLAEDFFDAGGGSLAAMRIAARLHLSVRQVFKLRTQRAIAEAVAGKGIQQL